MFGSRIKNLRNAKGLTQEELAKQLGISRSALSLYELEKREPDIDTFKKIASFFGVSTDYLNGSTNNVGNSNVPIIPSEEENPSFFFFFFEEPQIERLKALIKRNEITVKELASHIDVSPQELYALLDGEKSNLSIILKIADFFNVSMDYLLCRSDYEAVINPESEIFDLISYYEDLDRKDRRWIMGQMIDIAKKKSEPNLNPVAASEGLDAELKKAVGK